jgi:hypothetical protein
MSAVLAASLGFGAVAPAQTQARAAKQMPDAQVEANVLKALAAAPDLANQPVTTTTVYGVVTLSGSVQTEALRTEAETIASRTQGVQKVVDEMTLSPDTAGAQTPPDYSAMAADPQGGSPALQSDGTMAPQPPQGAAPATQAAPDAQASPNQANGPSYGQGGGPGAPEYRPPYAGQAAPPAGSAQGNYPGGYGPPPGYGQSQGYPPQQSQGYPPQQSQGYPPQQSQSYPPQQSQGYPPQQGYGYNGAPQPVFGGQEAGQMVTIPAGAMLRMRINQPMDSAHAKSGQHFNGIVVNDVVAGGAVAIPRGAAVEGTVIDAKKSGAVSGRGELSLQLTQVTLGGKTYPIASDVWARHAGDKGVQTVDRTAAGGVIGALIGAVAGGGEGAAIGAGAGAALGLGSSAASGGGQIYIPAEGLLTFQLAQPATVATVSQQEMDRLSQGVPANGQPALQRRPAPYYGPYYRPYPYPY